MVNPNKGEVEIKIDPERKVLITIDRQRPVILKFNTNSLCEAEEEIKPRTIFDILDDGFRKKVPLPLNEGRVLLAHGLGISKEAAGLIISQKTTDYLGEVLPKLGLALMYATDGNIMKYEKVEPTAEESELVVTAEEEDAETGEKKRKK